jgi:glycosyltransferase involved in cell wall biosynthesis
MALALGRHVPFVYRSIGDPDYWSGAPLRRARTRFFLRRAQAVTTGWSGARETLVARYGLSPSAVHVIPRGVDASRFAVPSDARRDDARRSFGIEGQLTIAVIGALSPEKRVDRAIDVAERLPNALLLIAGDGPQRAELETMASGRIGQRARFLGVQRDVAPVLYAADVLLVPSDTEGLAGVAIEAAFTRLPAVVTDVGGMRDIVVDGETGYVVATDDIDEMAHHVERAAQDRDALGVAAQRHCLERFELSPVVDRWEALVRDIAIR